jgi:hypothetical protein
VNDGWPATRRRPTPRNGTEAERTAYAPPQRGVVHHAVEPRRPGEEPDNTRTQERESSRTVIQPMSRNAPTARSPPRHKPQATRNGGRRLFEPTVASPPRGSLANQRTTIMSRSIIVGWAWTSDGSCCLMHYDQKKRSFCCSSAPAAANGPPKTLSSFLTQSYQSYRKLQPRFHWWMPDTAPPTEGCGDSVEKLAGAKASGLASRRMGACTDFCVRGTAAT